MVDQLIRQANTAYLVDSFQFFVAPKRLDNSKIRQKYLKSNWSAQQLADYYGVSKQMILGRLQKQGICNTRGRGRSSDNFRFPNPAYGYRVQDGCLVSNPQEMKIIRLISEMRSRQGLELERIADELNRRGYLTRLGKAWRSHTVKHVLKSWKDKI